MRVHILGICGTFMGGLAQLARELGHEVSGSDQGVYPPMSTQLEAAGIELTAGFDASQLDPPHDAVVVGNALTRGNACVERLLSEKRELISGPAWLARHVLAPRRVLAVAGTHGKTTTASMLAWILECAGREPGFLIGGVPGNFPASARLGRGRDFVVEADEYDCAFFDKRSKFVHYRAQVLVVNNLEFDHADIFRDIDDVRRQFHHAIRLMPREGTLIVADDDAELDRLLDMGTYCELQRFSGQHGRWRYRALCPDASRFEVMDDGVLVGPIRWQLIGEHNASNALAAIAAAAAVGVDAGEAVQALNRFVAPKRRMETIARIGDIVVYDDFAHHPSAVRASTSSLRAAVGDDAIVAVLDPASNTMRMGVHQHTLADALTNADRVLLHRTSGGEMNLDAVAAELGARASVHDDVADIVATLTGELTGRAHVLIMSNGGFGGLHRKLVEALEQR